MSVVASIKSAPEAWKLLNGLLCIYKPSKKSATDVRRIIKYKLCQDLNSMKTRDPESIVELRRLAPGEESPQEPHRKVLTTLHDGPDRIEIVKGLNYADHPAVIGPRYQKQDLKLYFANNAHYKFSGLHLLGINAGTRIAYKVKLSQWIRTFVVSGRFGIATSTYFDDGKIMEKSTYHKIQKTMLDRILSSLQASQQRLMFHTAGVPIHSQQAFELASKGMLRPLDDNTPVIYSLKCLNFKPPHFDIEVKVINPNADYLAGFIHDIGLKLHSVACCTNIRCIQHGPFTLDHALLMKHWEVQHIIQNMLDNSRILADFDLKFRDPLIRGSGADTEPFDADLQEDISENYDDEDYDAIENAINEENDEDLEPTKLSKSSNNKS